MKVLKSRTYVCNACFCKKSLKSNPDIGGEVICSLKDKKNVLSLHADETSNHCNHFFFFKANRAIKLKDKSAYHSD